MTKNALYITLFCCFSAFSQVPEYNPMKEMQTVEGYARITVQGTLRTWHTTYPGNGVRFFINGAPMGFTTRNDPAFTQEVPEGKYLIEACMGFWEPNDRVGGCITINLEAAPNTLYNIYHEIYASPQLSIVPTLPTQTILGIQEVKF